MTDGLFAKPAAIFVLIGCLLTSACASDEADSPWLKPDDAAVFGQVVTKPNLPALPKYAEVASRYNKRLIGTDRVVARANIQLTYVDKAGERKSESPEGTLQVISRPSLRLALSLGKAGQTLFWFGCDAERYWWLDLSDKDDRVAGVGRLALFDGGTGAGGGGAGQRLGIAIKPTDLARLLGVVPLDLNAKAQLQWSRDGKLLGIVTKLSGAGTGGPGGATTGLQRLWVDPATLVPQIIELYDSKARLVIVGEHEGQENVEITRTGVPELIGARPRLPARVYCRHIESGTDIRLTLTGLKDGPISDKAFNFDELSRRLGVMRVVDFDK